VYTSLMQMLHPAAQTAGVSPATSSSPTTSTSSSSSSDPGVDLTNTFLQLLTVQLENQSPLDPVDPNDFVVQLAQFDSLGELTQIQSLMQTLVNDVGGTTGSDAAAIANSTLSSNPNSISH
jgi:flagellar basal-body rod modification protein FlgD